jgi:hypothetical protein
MSQHVTRPQLHVIQHHMTQIPFLPFLVVISLYIVSTIFRTILQDSTVFFEGSNTFHRVLGSSNNFLSIP